MPHLQLLRPAQWSKNVFVFAGLVFGHKLGELDSVLLAIAGFICLCLLSSVVYVTNDIHDRKEDRLHPRKQNRPIAAGRVSVAAAAVIAVALLVVGLGASLFLSRAFFVVALFYLLLQTAYTWVLKHEVLLDVIAIGLGFVLRAVAGAVLVQVAISPWLVLCTFTLCLFMGFSKRRCELNALAGDGAGQHRKTLTTYTPELLNHMTTLTAGIAVVTFLLYATDDRTIREFHRFGSHSTYLLYTLPIVVYAIFRFAVLAEHGEVDGPTDVLLRDWRFQAALVLWALAAVAIIYFGEQIDGFVAGYLAVPA